MLRLFTAWTWGFTTTTTTTTTTLLLPDRNAAPGDGLAVWFEQGNVAVRVDEVAHVVSNHLVRHPA
jgi:hypothetical protein